MELLQTILLIEQYKSFRRIKPNKFCDFLPLAFLLHGENSYKEHRSATNLQNFTKITLALFQVFTLDFRIYPWLMNPWDVLSTLIQVLEACEMPQPAFSRIIWWNSSKWLKLPLSFTETDKNEPTFAPGLGTGQSTKGQRRNKGFFCWKRKFTLDLSCDTKSIFIPRMWLVVVIAS